MRAEPFGPFFEDPAQAAVLVDFDGSLAPIVDDPPAARPLPEAVDALTRLAAHVGVVGVVSGRPVSFLRRALPVPGLVLAGLYGMERAAGDDVVLDDAVAPYLGVADEAAADLERALPGLYIERKGTVTCVAHWRTAPERAEEAMALATRVAHHHGLELRPGRMSAELRPPVAVDKGTTVEALVAGFQVALFAGDDHGDLDAFDALDRLVASQRIRWAVKIAVRSPETPRALVERATETVAGPAELARVLAGLADHVESYR